MSSDYDIDLDYTESDALEKVVNAAKNTVRYRLLNKIIKNIKYKLIKIILI